MFTAQGLTVAAVGQGAELSSAGDKPLHHLSEKARRERPEKGVIPPQRKAQRSAN